MQLDRIGVLDGRDLTTQETSEQARNQKSARRQAGGKLRAVAAIMLTMASCVPPGFAAQTPAGTTGADKAASDLPVAPTPIPTDPFDLKSSSRDYSKPYAGFWGNPVSKYRATSVPKASFENSVRLSDMLKDGKLYLSLSDAIALALENNYDIAIARLDLDIADTDILRSKTGQSLLGAPSGLITNTQGGSTSILSAGGGPGGSTGGAAGAGSGVSGLTLTTGGAGPSPESLDPFLGRPSLSIAITPRPRASSPPAQALPMPTTST
jgi:hypothetical protein